LRDLCLSDNMYISGPGLNSLSALIDLRVLNLDFCDSITEPDLQFLSLLINLNVLSLDMCGGVSDVVIDSLRTLVDLNDLNISSSLITDAGLSALTGVTADGLQTIAFGQLRFLSVINCADLSHNAVLEFAMICNPDLDITN
jgi:hypothetical protein